MKTNAHMGLIANVLVGIAGSLLGFWIAGLLGFAPAGGIVRFAVALAGAVLLIFILGSSVSSARNKAVLAGIPGLHGVTAAIRMF